MKPKPVELGIACILVGALWFRSAAYGDLRLSVATMDTESYQLAARAPAFSWASLTGERLLTTNIFYQLTGAQNCAVQALSIPAIGREAHREIQACFSRTVLAQSLISIVAWGFFVWSFSARLRHGAVRLAAATVLSVFAFAPQLADWDSILSSESLTFSLFALSLALVIGAVANMADHDSMAKPRLMGTLWTSAALVALAAWVFARDANAYSVLILGLIAALAAVRHTIVRRTLMVAAVALLGVTLLASFSAFESARWKVPLTDAFQEYILPFPTRVAELERQGMPEPGSPAYDDWFERRAPATYSRFLAGHPAFVASAFFANLNALFAENNQPYFKSPSLPLHDFAVGAGDFVHTKSSSVVLMDVLIVLAVVYAGARSGNQRVRAAAWIGSWLLLAAAATLVLTFFADPIGVQRHVVFALFLFRLLVWLGLAFLIDLAVAADRVAAQA